MAHGPITALYLIASICFIISLRGLNHQESARAGNLFGMAGMIIAVLATLFSQHVGLYPIILTMILIGAIIGLLIAWRVQMTAMPQLVAMFHSFVGLSAVMVGIANFIEPNSLVSHQNHIIHDAEIFIGVFIGAITFTGSLMAFGKLQAIIPSKPLLLPLRHGINLLIILVCIYFGYEFINHGPTLIGLTPLLIMTGLAFILGAHMVLAIGGADMPVVISMLNSYSGWAAAATGFMLENDSLIIVGALVGSSGAILSYIMCRAMNRRFINVILGGFGTKSVTKTEAIEGNIISISAEETAELLANAKQVIIVPGYGMAVAHAQHAISDLVDLLQKQDIHVRFAIHPVAGRMPGHMNVLLAEAKVPYDIVFSMDDINQDFSKTDVVLVIGANDIVNPSAQEVANSPIAGMPVLEVWQARFTVILKRSMATGYSGVDNPLFYKDNSRMLFGDARDSVEHILKYLEN